MAWVGVAMPQDPRSTACQSLQGTPATYTSGDAGPTTRHDATGIRLSSHLERLGGIDVVHLCFRPPYSPGSYNSLVGALLDRLEHPRQVAISLSDGPVPPDGLGRDHTLLVDGEGLGLWREAALRLPQALRTRLFGGIASRERIRYAVAVRSLLEQAQPPVVVVWDDYKLGSFLRRAIGDGPTLVLSQHGRSYHLTPEAARALYRLVTYDAVITLTHASYRTDRDQLHAYEPLVLVRPNGVDPDLFTPDGDGERAMAKERWGLPPDGLVVLALARLVPSKGVHLLLHSWSKVVERVPNAVLWVVGGGDDAYVAELARTTADLGLARSVRFEGRVDRAQVPACHAAADLYAFPSVQDEGHPLSLLEAMSSGLACVASDSPVVRELHQGAVELVADPNLQDAFVEPVIGLLLDDARRVALGRSARTQVLERFTLDAYLSDLGEFMQRLVRSTAGDPT